MSEEIKVTEIEKVIMDALEEYADKAEDVIGSTLPLVGRETVDDLKVTSPKRTGHYASSWTYGMKQSRGSKKNNKLIVYNKKYYRLVHLLEKGHASRNGGRVEAIVHVKPAQDKAEKKAIERIKDKLGRLGV